ncbi:MAG: glycosyltransferase, partial [Actinobacteria bacterium]|nr:glycosyltransferase [Actinomycetota bacterium]
AYQVAPYIGAALTSALDQTEPALEAIVCDDGSTDDLATALQPYRDRIVLLRQENAGEGAAKNAAARAASGDFVVILDGDDMFLPERLARLGDLASARPDLDILATDVFHEVDGDVTGRHYHGWVDFETRDQRAAIMRRNFLWPPSIRRTTWLDAGGFDESLRQGTSDWEFFFRLIMGGSRAGLVDEPLAHYRIWEGSLTASRVAIYKGRADAFEKMAAHPALTPEERALLQGSRERYRREWLLADMEEAIRARSPDARTKAGAVARKAELSPRTRIKAAGAAVAPGAAAGLLKRREAKRGQSRLRRAVRVDPVPPRVTYVVDSAEYGGAEAYVGRLLDQLGSRVTRSLVATRPVPAPLRDATARAGAELVEVAPVAGKTDARALFGLARAIRATRPDLVHVNLTIPTNNRHAIAAAAVLRVPSVATLHLTAPVSSGVHGRVMQALFTRPRAVIAVSEEIRRFAARTLGVPADRIVVAPNGVDMPEPVALGDRVPVRIGALGRLTSQKGYDVLVEATRRLVATGVEVEVELAGDGPDAPALAASAVGLPIRLLGFVDDTDGFLRSLDVFCLPSRAEGLPFALLEAMAVGLPCVASAVGDIPAALGGAGRLVPPDDPKALCSALAGLTGSAPARRELGAAARARVEERYSIEAMAQATLAVYSCCR